VAADVFARQNPFGRLVFALDERLRRRHAVFDYSDREDCILRIQFDRADGHFVLSDGTCLKPGDRLINIHLWNEHIPAMGANGATIGWARHIARLLDGSLLELTRYLAAHPALDDVAALRSVMNLARVEQNQQLERTAGRYGFEPIAEIGKSTFGRRLHQAGDNLLCLMFVLARNPAAARLDVLLRGRSQIFLPRSVLDRRYRPRLSEPIREDSQ
jgi:hypothetical protein